VLPTGPSTWCSHDSRWNLLGAASLIQHRSGRRQRPLSHGCSGESTPRRLSCIITCVPCTVGTSGRAAPWLDGGVQPPPQRPIWLIGDVGCTVACWLKLKQCRWRRSDRGPVEGVWPFGRWFLPGRGRRAQPQAQPRAPYAFNYEPRKNVLDHPHSRQPCESPRGGMPDSPIINFFRPFFRRWSETRAPP